MTPKEYVSLDLRLGQIVKEAKQRRKMGVTLHHAWNGGGRCPYGLKQALAGLVGPSRVDGPAELQTVKAEFVVTDYLLGILERPPYLRSCPRCGGPTWDNRKKKRDGRFKANAPDFSCCNRDCGGAIWPRSRS